MLEAVLCCAPCDVLYDAQSLSFHFCSFTVSLCSIVHCSIHCRKQVNC